MILRKAGGGGVDKPGLIAGGIFMGLGAFAVAAASQWRFGTSAQMGPGYLPVVLGAILILLGLSVFMRALMSGTAVAVERPDLPVLTAIIGPIFLFAAVLPYAGLLLSVAGLVVLTRLAGERMRLVETTLIAVALSGLVAAIFVWGLGMRLPLLPAFVATA